MRASAKAVLVVIAAMLAVCSVAEAQTTLESHATGLFTLLGESTARVSVVNVGEERGITVSSIAFLDQNGTLVTEMPRPVELALNRATFFDFGPVKLPPGQHIHVRAVVGVQYGAGKSKAVRFIASMQTLQVVTCFQAPPEGIISPPQNLTAVATEMIKN